MMAQPAAAHRARRTAAAPITRPALALVAKPEHARSIVPYTALITLIIVAAMAATLALNIAMSTTSYEITKLQVKEKSLSQQRESLQQQQDALSGPQQLEARARDLGMVPATEPAYIDLASGTIIGTAAPAGSTPAGGDPADLVVTTTPVNRLPAYDYGMGNEGRR